MHFVTKWPHARPAFLELKPHFPQVFSHPGSTVKTSLKAWTKNNQLSTLLKQPSIPLVLLSTPCTRSNDTLVFPAEPIQLMSIQSSAFVFLGDQKGRHCTVGPSSIRWSDRWCFSLPQAPRQKGSHTTSSSPTPDTHREGQPDRGQPLIDRLATIVQYRAGVQDVCHTQA